MDPLSALSVAAAVVQFVDFTCQLVSKGFQLSKSTKGALPETLDLEATTADLIEIDANLQSHDRLSCSTRDEALLEKLRVRCIEIGTELLRRLDLLKVPSDSKHRKWKSFRQALKTVWSKKDLDQLSSDLLAFRGQMEFRILVSLKETHDLSVLQHSERFDTLDKAVQDLSRKLIVNESLFESELRFQRGVITRLHRELKDHVTDQHNQTRIAIIDAIQLSQSRHRGTRDFDSEPQDEQAEAHKILDKARTAFLASLAFPMMYDRFDTIAEAHERTFNWLFEDGALQDVTWSPFLDWLETGSGIYWISGKAGSGKSTLMRYITQGPRTMEALQSWAGQSIALASYYFWRSGTPDQASLIGLYRALMYQILSQKPHLIEGVFPTEFEQCASQQLQGQHSPDSALKWRLQNLTEGFRSLFQQNIGKVCIFVDGLDEFEGEPSVTLKLFKSLVSLNPNVKFCLSSRPWVEFENAFRDQPKLKVQDLTNGDIRLYVTDLLRTEPNMEELYLREPLEAPELVEEIVEKAQGVFLWVKFVVASLLRGLEYNDSILVLQARLREMPPEIQELYLYMLKRVEPVHRSESSRIFQLVNAHDASQSEFDLGSVGFNGLTLSFAEEFDETQIFDIACFTFNQPQICSRIARADSRLRVCCAGLLEMSKPPIEGQVVLLQDLKPHEIRYYHRTAYDFIHSSEASKFISKGIVDPHFNAHLQLIVANVALLAISSLSSSDIGDMCTLLNQTMRNAYLAEQTTGQCHKELLDVFDGAMSKHFDQNDRLVKPSDWTAFVNTVGANGTNKTFLSVAIQFDLLLYIEQAIIKDKAILHSKQGRPYLDYAVYTYYNDSEDVCQMDSRVRTIALLLEHGADPNQCWDDPETGQICTSPWIHFLWRIYTGNSCFVNHILNLAKIFTLMLENGADPYANSRHLEIGDGGKLVLIYVIDVIERLFVDYSHERDMLKDLLASKSAAVSELPLELETPDTSSHKTRKRAGSFDICERNVSRRI